MDGTDPYLDEQWRQSMPLVAPSSRLTSYINSQVTSRSRGRSIRFDRASEAQGAPWTPVCNVWDDEQGFCAQLALPGWEPQEVMLEVTNQVLSIKGERQQQLSVFDRSTHVQEIAGERFMRVFRLPAFVDSQQASATQKNGLLTITFPKRVDAKSRRIMIEG